MFQKKAYNFLHGSFLVYEYDNKIIVYYIGRLSVWHGLHQESPQSVGG